MILRLSAKLARKVHAETTQVLPLDENPFADWSAHLFTADRVHYILITNTVSLYSVVLPGKGITDTGELISRTLSLLGQVLKDDGFGFHFARLIAPFTACVRLSKSLNATVSGSMNALAYQAQGHLLEAQQSTYESSLNLNSIPMKQLKYASPRQAFARLSPVPVDAAT